MNLAKELTSFFNSKSDKKINSKISVIREDGIILYSNAKKDHNTGALIAGLWQASTAIKSSLNESSDVLDYRLSFDKTDEGLYILPVKMNNQNLILSSEYKELLNPAKHKLELRLIKSNLEKYITNLDYNPKDEQRQGYLFDNITDDEMDRLFAHSGV
ncbi:MAG: hypothetical protein N4A33_09430 [Bacteriovoracaceae bacterium]|jgi:hypothetical protein|nr:hypothetical protein [Bacteriovoracaceae bacterium]